MTSVNIWERSHGTGPDWSVGQIPILFRKFRIVPLLGGGPEHVRIRLARAEVLAVTVLVLGLCFPRHRRRDLMVAYFGVNIGVPAVADALGTTGSGAGLGKVRYGSAPEPPPSPAGPSP
jgi:hypothetical protein